MTLIEMLNSRAWEHRQHRALREQAARRIAELEAQIDLVRWHAQAGWNAFEDLELPDAADQAMHSFNDILKCIGEKNAQAHT